MVNKPAGAMACVRGYGNGLQFLAKIFFGGTQPMSKAYNKTCFLVISHLLFVQPLLGMTSIPIDSTFCLELGLLKHQPVFVVTFHFSKEHCIAGRRREQRCREGPWPQMAHELRRRS